MSEFNTGDLSQAEVWITSGVHELLKVHSAAYALLMALSDEITLAWHSTIVW